MPVSWWNTYIDNNYASCTNGFVYNIGELRVRVVLKMSQVLLDVVQLKDGPKGQIPIGVVYSWREEF